MGTGYRFPKAISSIGMIRSATSSPVSGMSGALFPSHENIYAPKWYREAPRRSTKEVTGRGQFLCVKAWCQVPANMFLNLQA
jgi:hypothetical protein